MFRYLFARKARPLEGAPSIRRLKTYSSQTGYVYQYYFEGKRPGEHTSDIEFIFTASADRKSWRQVAVLVSGAALRGWETQHERELSATERYAIAKLALFREFDRQAVPDALFRGGIEVTAADAAAILETLGLD